ncbi:hypothetical protein BC828DRAFT_418544 [Blastocladiella britannica]|nr:hypothetical protein BC828DRAFT_418544 [Blastocladiella britannica]
MFSTPRKRKWGDAAPTTTSAGPFAATASARGSRTHGHQGLGITATPPRAIHHRRRQQPSSVMRDRIDDTMDVDMAMDMDDDDDDGDESLASGGGPSPTPRKRRMISAATYGGSMNGQSQHLYGRGPPATPPRAGGTLPFAVVKSPARGSGRSGDLFFPGTPGKSGGGMRMDVDSPFRPGGPYARTSACGGMRSTPGRPPFMSFSSPLRPPGAPNGSMLFPWTNPRRASGAGGPDAMILGTPSRQVAVAAAAAVECRPSPFYKPELYEASPDRIVITDGSVTPPSGRSPLPLGLQTPRRNGMVVKASPLRNGTSAGSASGNGGGRGGGAPGRRLFTDLIEPSAEENAAVERMFHAAAPTSRTTKPLAERHHRHHHEGSPVKAAPQFFGSDPHSHHTMLTRSASKRRISQPPSLLQPSVHGGKPLATVLEQPLRTRLDFTAVGAAATPISPSSSAHTSPAPPVLPPPTAASLFARAATPIGFGNNTAAATASLVPSPFGGGTLTRSATFGGSASTASSSTAAPISAPSPFLFTRSNSMGLPTPLHHHHHHHHQHTLPVTGPPLEENPFATPVAPSSSTDTPSSSSDAHHRPMTRQWLRVCGSGGAPTDGASATPPPASSSASAVRSSSTHPVSTAHMVGGMPVRLSSTSATDHHHRQTHSQSHEAAMAGYALRMTPQRAGKLRGRAA